MAIVFATASCGAGLLTVHFSSSRWLSTAAGFPEIDEKISCASAANERGFDPAVARMTELEFAGVIFRNGPGSLPLASPKSSARAMPDLSDLAAPSQRT